MRDWKMTTIAECSTILGDGLHGTPKYDENGEYAFINGNNLHNGKIVIKRDTKRVGLSEYEKHKKELTDRTVLVSINGTLGNVAVYNGEKVILGKSACYFNVSTDCDVQFMRYVVSSPRFQQYINSVATGTTIKNVSLKQMREYSFPIPELKEQQRIAKVLHLLDQKIENNRKINDNLQQQLRAIFMERFTNNPALESIQQVPLSELCSVVTKGTTPTTLGKPFVDRGINFLKAESILDNHSLDKGKFVHIDEETHDMLKRSVIYAGDIVFTIAGTLGRFALIDSDILPANTNQAVAIIRADKGKISPEYLYACFIGNWHNDYYSKRVQQAVQANLSLTTIKSLPIPVLTQDEMVSYMALISPIIKMLKQNEMGNERLAALRDTLLPRLMSGEVDVSNIDI